MSQPMWSIKDKGTCYRQHDGGQNPRMYENKDTESTSLQKVPSLMFE